jgi:superfamily II DNA or RNA helicase
VIEELDFDESKPRLSPRPYQSEAMESVDAGWARFSRQLISMGTGLGKTLIFSNIANLEARRGGRALILAHTDELLEQARDKLFRATGLVADKEKADEMASQQASVVVGSVQTMARKTRLMGFRDDHFSLVIVDEAHRSLADSYQRILRYFHFGAHAIAEDWEMPPPDIPTIHKAKILGVTATPDRGDKRSLGEFFQHVAYDYGLLQGVRDGYLVRPIVRNIPIKIDLKGIRRMAGDLNAEDLAIRITPFLRAIAAAIKTEAGDRKTVVFTPSVETARLVAEACRDNGLSADFVSGGCTDRDAKIAAFDKGPAGSVIACAMLLVEGWDCDTASCVCVLRPTKIRSMFVQAVGRTTRPLTGLIDGLATADERVAAIAASAKPNCMILDPLWLADNLDLIRPIDLVVTKKRLKVEDLDGDLIDAAEKAERDLLKSLEKAAKKHSRKNSRTIDPLVFAVSVGDDALKSYTPSEPWEATEPDPDQIEFLAKNGIDVSKILCRGHAAKIEERIRSRKNLGLCTPKQMNFLVKMGLPESEAALKSFEEAGRLIGRRMQQYRR